MARKTSDLPPQMLGLLQRFGERLHLLRVRRRLSAKQMAAAAGMSVMTLRSLERGGDGVTMGAYLAVMNVLGIERDLEELAAAAFLPAVDGAERTTPVIRPSGELAGAEAPAVVVAAEAALAAMDVTNRSSAASVHSADGGVVDAEAEAEEVAVAREDQSVDGEFEFEWLEAPARDLRLLLGDAEVEDGAGGTLSQKMVNEGARAEDEAGAIEIIPDLLDVASSEPAAPS